MKPVLTVVVPVLALLAATGCLLTGCSDRSDAPPRSIFLVTLDTTRADHIDYTPGPDCRTPNLAALASRGQYFDNAHALIPITLPSHASMFYSLPPHRLKIYNNGQPNTVSEPPVARLLQQSGRTTGAVISLGVLKGEFGLDKGFDRYIENFPPHQWIKGAEDVNRDAFDLIRNTRKTKPDSDYFFWLHYSDPHEPYFPPHTDGTFRILAADRELFRTPCTEQPVVNVTFTLPPGPGHLVLATRIPAVFEKLLGHRHDPRTTYVKLRDFSLAPEQPAEPAMVDVRVPTDWNSKTDRSGTHYYINSGLGHQEIHLVNRGTKPVSMNLRFIYSLWVNDESRRIFYEEEVKYMDHQLGRLLDFLKKENLLEDSVFVIMGDHGETLGEYRDHFGHVHYLNPSAVRVPLILSGKGIPPLGRRVEVASNLNIAPTLLDLAGLAKPDYMRGHSLLAPAPPTRLLLETYSPEAFFDAFSVIDYPWQVCFYPGRQEEKLEFFDLRRNHLREKKKPGDGVDRNTQDRHVQDRTVTVNDTIRGRLINRVLEISRVITATKGKPTREVSDRHREILKSLGYL